MVSIIFFKTLCTIHCYLIERLTVGNRRLLPDDEKKAYIDAVLCMQKKPAFSTLNTTGAVTRFDDFQSLHIRQADFVHGVVCYFSGGRDL